MTLSNDVQKWLDWQNDQFMVVDVQEFSATEAAEFMQDDAATGFYARLSAPGYLDCTDWSGPFDTEEEAIQAIYEMYGDDMPDDEESPDEGDYVLSDTGPLGSKTNVGLHEGQYLGTFDTEEEARQFVQDRMEQEQFFPNVWKLSDHGNWIGPIDQSE